MNWLALLTAVAALGAATVACGRLRWGRATRALLARLEASRANPGAAVDLGRLEALPAPVARYFRAVLTDGQPRIAAASVRHEGTFDMGKETPRWTPFRSRQRVITRRPGFDWDARIRVAPGLAVFVRDAYAGGEGVLTASLLGSFTVMKAPPTKELAVGELMRWAAETPWYPTALLADETVRWTAVDDRSADATFTDGGFSRTLRFTFDDAGLVSRVRAEARGRTVNGAVIPTPWEGRYGRYERRDAMLVPLEAEVAWILPEGPRPYWRGRIVSVAYELAEGPSSSSPFRSPS